MPQPSSADMLDPRATTWERGIGLGPVEPRLRESMVVGYMMLLEAARYVGNAAEEAHCLSRLAELTGGQP